MKRLVVGVVMLLPVGALADTQETSKTNTPVVDRSGPSPLQATVTPLSGLGSSLEVKPLGALFGQTKQSAPQAKLGKTISGHDSEPTGLGAATWTGESCELPYPSCTGAPYHGSKCCLMLPYVPGLGHPWICVEKNALGIPIGCPASGICP